MNRKTFFRLAGYALFFIILTLVFCIVNYPGENLTRTVNGWLSGATGDAVSVRNVSFSPPLSLKLGGVAVDMGKDRRMLGDVRVAPVWLPMLTGNRAASGKLVGPWASSRFVVRSRGEGWGVKVDPLKVSLEALPLPEDAPLKLRGTAAAVLELDFEDPENIQLQGQGHITGTDIEVFGGILEPLGLSPLRFPSLSLFFTVQDNLVTINENSLTGDISATARGTVRLVPSQPGNSRLDLVLDVKPGAEAKKFLSPFYSIWGLKERANGSVILRIRGTVDRPSITS